MGKRILLCVVLALAAFSCRSDKPIPPPSPTPAAKQADETPDVIKIAVQFVAAAGLAAELPAASARIVSQNSEAYYVAFDRKTAAPHRAREAVVKVYKKNGFAEWEEY